MQGHPTDDPLIREIDQAVITYKKSSKARNDYMMYQQDLIRYGKKVAEEAREEGRVEGKAEGKLDMLIELVADGSISLEKAAEKFGLTTEEFQEKVTEEIQLQT